MFERFTDRARRVIVVAQEESRLLKHDYIGTEHLLLGLVHEGEGFAAKVLDSFELSSLDEIRLEVVELSPMGETAQRGHIPFTPVAKKALELALREALRMDHSYIGSEHLLLGLISLGEGKAFQILGRHADATNLEEARLRVGRAIVRQPLISPRKEPFVIDVGGGGIPDGLRQLREVVGDDQPDFKRALITFLEEWLERLRAEVAQSENG